MNYRPTLEEARTIAKSGDYKVIPISCENLFGYLYTNRIAQKIEESQQALLHAGKRGGFAEMGEIHLSRI